MTEIDYYHKYLEAICALPLPTNPKLKDSFCDDIQASRVLISKLKDPPRLQSLTLLETLARIEFYIAKNTFSDLIQAYGLALQNVKNIMTELSEKFPELPQQLSINKTPHSDFIQQIAQSVYVPDPGEQKAIARFRYIQHSAESRNQAVRQSIESQNRFRQVYSSYTTKPTKS